MVERAERGEAIDGRECLVCITNGGRRSEGSCEFVKYGYVKIGSAKEVCVNATGRVCDTMRRNRKCDEQEATGGRGGSERTIVYKLFKREVALVDTDKTRWDVLKARPGQKLGNKRGRRRASCSVRRKELGPVSAMQRKGWDCGRTVSRR